MLVDCRDALPDDRFDVEALDIFPEDKLCLRQQSRASKPLLLLRLGRLQVCNLHGGAPLESHGHSRLQG